MSEKHNLKEKTVGRTILRIFGPIITIIGIVLLVIAISDFFAAMNSPFGHGPKKFHLGFIGMPSIFVGLVMTSAGYMGTVARYQASQVAPVAKDYTNYMVEGTKESIHTVASTVAGAFKGETKSFCPNCGNDLKPDDAFCDNCGKPLASKCKQCGASNDMDAKFCSKCGNRI